MSEFLWEAGVSIGARLKVERVRLGFSHAAIGHIGGVAINAQGRYDNGIRFARADYLANVAQALDSASECLEKAKELIH
ncbi:hypothetical protein SAMN04490179_3853 [Pseudomonas antarctica]|uniref:Uncharacterized protein n=1 Tax=Pseudomonas antarctica TaxID=219572 RepID=A0A1H0ARV0_9PSED|nr:XRE family transcriptional regulator [Pseudomonas antarctica]KAF2407471.1 hypothetical protein PSAN_44000 [Pseudomonas antarctica]SDN36278.1 hypothetical protein SAMN04490179_3853 [Pseudomonas antarctica]